MNYPADSLEACDFYRYVKNLDAVSFNLYDYQADVANTLITDRKIITCSARQMGMSTIMLLLAHWFCHRENNQKLCFLSLDQATISFAVSVFTKFTRQNLFKTISNTSYGQRIHLDNGSEIIFTKPSRFDLAHLYLLDGVFMDMADFGFDDTDFGNVWKILQTRLSKNPCVCINSTPVGKGTWFRKMYENDNEFTKFYLPLELNKKLFKQSMKRTAMLSSSQFKNDVLADWID